MAKKKKIRSMILAIKVSNLMSYFILFFKSMSKYLNTSVNSSSVLFRLRENLEYKGFEIDKKQC